VVLALIELPVIVSVAPALLSMPPPAWRAVLPLMVVSVIVARLAL
jgi:hypothetical protein